tara:strand:- start:136 stop:246 length:111 start_codon:yes stop_codon:yes gene_type:complete
MMMNDDGDWVMDMPAGATNQVLQVILLAGTALTLSM